MNTGNKKILLLLAFTALIVNESCRQDAPARPQVVQAPLATGHTFAANGSVREMNINPEVTNFPDGDGKNEFMSYCAMCHSLRYISMQPDFSEEMWEEEVHKMVAKYNAPIDSNTCKKIVSYLVKVKGV